MTPDQRVALDEYVATLRRHYGKRVVDVLVFGSRARGDARPDSDVDLAVILEDGDWRFWTEKMHLAGLAYETLVDQGLYIQPWPVARSRWENPALHHNRRFIEAARRDARQVSDAA